MSKDNEQLIKVVVVKELDVAQNKDTAVMVGKEKMGLCFTVWLGARFIPETDEDTQADFKNMERTLYEYVQYVEQTGEITLNDLYRILSGGTCAQQETKTVYGNLCGARWR